MVEDRPEDIELPTDSSRAKRAPPTIDLEATEVSGETRDPNSGKPPKPSTGAGGRLALVPVIAAAVSGAGAAALVIALAWLLGWPGGASELATPVAAPGRNPGNE